MRNAVFLALAAFLAMGVHGGIPTSAEGWYTPAKGFSRQAGSGTVVWTDDNGDKRTSTVTVDDEGKITSDCPEDFPDNVALKTAYNALVKACNNAAYNAVQDEAIDTIGKNLHDLTSATGINITNPETGKSYTIRFGGGTIENAVNTTGGGNIPATSDEDDPADGVSLTWTGAGNTLEIAGWKGRSPKATYSLGQVLSGKIDAEEDPNFHAASHIVVRGLNGKLGYMQIGGISVSNNTAAAEADNVSVATNKSGKLEIAGFEEAAEDNDIPVVYNKKVNWRTIDTDVFSIGSGESGGNYKISLKGYSADLGPNKYLGTDSQKSWGVHDIPSVTTNNVVGDDVTIQNISQDVAEKVFAIKPPAGDGLYGIANSGGLAAYYPIPEASTNDTCACSQKWEQVIAWISNGSTPVTLEWLASNPGIPGNWLDGSSMSRVNDLSAGTMKLEINDWSGGTPCRKNLGGLLTKATADDAAEASRHLIVTRHEDGNGNVSVHYLPIGSLAVGVDGMSVITNADGRLSLAGFSGNIGDGYMPVTKSLGMGEVTLEWVPTNAAPASAANVAWRYDPDAKEWKNAHVMVGTTVVDVSASATSDGTYYIHVDTMAKTAELTLSPSTPSDTDKYIYVGTVSGGRQTDGIYTTPIVFIWE